VVVHLPLEVVPDQLVVGGVEPEPGRKSHGDHYKLRTSTNKKECVHLEAVEIPVVARAQRTEKMMEKQRLSISH
jgi:hypothetical protein